jgi:hypothetical protein
MKKPDVKTIRKEEEPCDPSRFGSVHFYPASLKDEKGRVKFIQSVERVCRNCFEMKNYLSYLRDEVKLDSCTMLKGAHGSKVDIEIHHYPMTLFDICMTILRKFESDGRQVSVFLIAQEVVHLHYRNMVGLVPLSKTAHELAHAGKVAIPMNCVFGDVISFLRENADHVDPELIAKMESILSMDPAALENLNARTLRLDPVMNPDRTLPGPSEIQKALEFREEPQKEEETEDNEEDIPDEDDSPF